MRKLSVSVIGCGSWGRNHARVYKELENVTLISVVDKDETQAKEIGNRYGVEWYTDAEKVFQNSDIEAVSICTPHNNPC